VPDNAIYHLAEALIRVSKYKFPAQTNEVTKAYLEQSAKAAPAATASTMRAAAQGTAKAIEQLADSSTALNATLRTTCVATMLDGGHAVNALPQTAGAVVNCRVLPGTKPEEVLATLKQIVADEQVAITPVGEIVSGPASPLRPDLMRAASRITDTMWSGVPVVPIMVMGATDGLYLRNAGIPTYGIQGLFVEINDFRAHGRDERLGIQQFYEGETFLYELVKALSN
jgi:acetylornithine deacetylase/succinyl-diaminopimelate desuccinylase-like protein